MHRDISPYNILIDVNGKFKLSDFGVSIKIYGDTKGEVNRKTKDQMVNIFLPTTPNPTSGFLLFVPKKDILVLNMTVEEGIKMIISAGMLTPTDNQKKIKSLKKLKK